MTGSDRLPNSTETLLRAPYAAPRITGDVVRAEGRAVASALMPFVPREFRNAASRDASSQEIANDRSVTVMPPVEQSIESTETLSHFFAVPQPEMRANDETELQNNFSAIDDDLTHFVGAADEPTLPADLPWIDAFAEEAPEAEDAWPLGEAGKRLDELTQSLTSIDESRARQQAENENAEPVQSSAEHEMWSEEEWIDIMPAPLPASSSTELHHFISEAEANAEPVIPQPLPETPVGAESAARALEGLAQRVRAGQVQVPAFKSDTAEEAVLAGLLASMLGWRQ